MNIDELLSRDRLASLLRAVRKMNIGIVGDVMLDRHVYFRPAQRENPEFSAPILQEDHRTVMPGGAANAARNAVALGANACLFGIVGDDRDGRELRDVLSDYSIQDDTCMDNTCTIVKERHWVFDYDKNEFIYKYRIDRERPFIPGKNSIYTLQDMLSREPDGIVVSCYNKGCLSEDVWAVLFKSKLPLFVDTKVSQLDHIKERTNVLLKINEREAQEVLGRSYSPKLGYAQRLLDELEVDVVVTLGSEGAVYATRNEESVVSCFRNVDVEDVIGCGDTINVVLSLFLLSGASFSEAVAVSQIAGPINAEHKGAYGVNQEDILEAYDAAAGRSYSKSRSVSQSG